MKLVECWRWRYRDAESRVWRTTLPIPKEEAAKYPGSERIDGTMCVRDLDRPEEAAATPAWLEGR